jgi:signal transduction histidine kinase
VLARVTTRKWALEAGLAAAIAVVTQLEIWAPHALLRPTHMTGPRAAVSVVYLVAVLTLVVRARFPVGAVLVVCVLLGGEWLAFGSPESFGSFMLPVVASYSVAAYAGGRRALAGLGMLLALAAVWTLSDPSQTTIDKHVQSLLWLAPIPVLWLVGSYVRRHRLIEQAHRATLARLEREAGARGAVEEERARIARELHDAVGHSVSVMTVQASAVRRLLAPEQTRELEALTAVEQTGRDALAEMRRMVGVLRTAGQVPALAPQPGVSQLRKLVEQICDAGLHVELRFEGDAVQLPAGLNLTVYRLVQEGLTNALRHSGAQQAEVLVRYEPRAVEIAVTDDGCGPTNATSGHGLIGLSERVSVYGGQLSTGGLQRGGFELRARLPLTSP